jgi:alpha-glucuronidase
MNKLFILVLLVVVSLAPLPAEDGYNAWLRYPMIEDEDIREEYVPSASEIVLADRTKLSAHARSEIRRGLIGLLGIRDVNYTTSVKGDGAIIMLAADHMKKMRRQLVKRWSDMGQGATARAAVNSLGDEGYWIFRIWLKGKHCIVIYANTDRGLVFGSFALLRHLQLRRPLEGLSILDKPRNPLRIMNHWDNMNGSVERGYAGKSIYRWDRLPVGDRRYRDYARMLVSTGVNGCVINNVNADARFIDTENLKKAAVISQAFGNWGIDFYFAINFSSPMKLGKLPTADPLDPDVRKWWKDKVDEIYKLVPGFAGFIIKADSEGQPGPFKYKRNHADGANCIAAALKPHGGILIWRAFVYDKKGDRATKAYAEFKPLDGKFADNVIVQVKNGPIDFQVREPISPLFGAVPKTNLMLELQITQEYTGYSTHLCYMIPQWKEILDFDTHVHGPGSTVASVISGSLHKHKLCGIAGVANIGRDRNWTGHHLAAANTYGWGRLAWSPTLSSEVITDEWIRMTFGHDPVVVKTINKMLLSSWRIYENYNAPLGVGVVCGSSHYEPAPQTRGKYHKADSKGVGYDRTVATGSSYAAQYHPDVARVYESLDTCPDELLLFFHHVPYTHRLKSGKTVIQHIYDTHFEGVKQVEQMLCDWNSLSTRIEEERHLHVQNRIQKQLLHAKKWRDSINGYFHKLSGIEDEKGRKLP